MDLDKYNDMRRIKNFSAYFGCLPVSMMIQNGSKNIASKLTLTMDCIASMFYAKDKYEELFDESDEFKTPEEEWNAGLKHFKDLKDILTEGDNFNEVMKGIEQADEFSKAPGMNFKQQFFDYLEFVNLNF